MYRVVPTLLATIPRVHSSAKQMLRFVFRYDSPIMRTVLFVCTGNTCRSPMAEGIARKLALDGALGAEGRTYFFASAGTQAFEHAPISEETADVLEALGAPHDGHSMRLSAEMQKARSICSMRREIFQIPSVAVARPMKNFRVSFSRFCLLASRNCSR